jgi:hypothetical protein
MIPPVILTTDELEQVINRVTALSRKELGAARICRLLAENHSVLTVDVNRTCSVGNISDVVGKAINPRIADLGLYVACMKPARAILNKFNQPSGMHFWSFYRDTAANDPDYHQECSQEALRGDLSALQQQDKAIQPSTPLELPDLLDIKFDPLPDIDFGPLPDLEFDPLPDIDFECGHHAGR